MLRTLILTALFLMTACAPASSPAPDAPPNRTEGQAASGGTIDGLGFYPLSTPGLPPAIVAASHSVFDLRVLAAGDEKFLREVDVTNGKGKDLKAKFQAMDRNVFDDNDKVVLIRQIERCERDADPQVQQHCGITFDIRRSSGFLAGNGSTLWTNAHVIDGFLTALEKYEQISKSDQFKNKKELRVFIFTQDGELLVDPYIDTVTAHFIPEQTPMAGARKNFYAEDCDYVGLSLSRSIGSPLPLARGGGSAGSHIYILGFPVCTHCDNNQVVVEDVEDFSDRSPGLNSDGKGLKVSAGRVLGTAGLAAFFGIQQSSLDLLRLEQMLFSTADSQVGDSGGPVLNDHGEVLAIHAGGRSKIINGQFKRISRAVIPPPFLQRLSQK